MSTPGLLVYYRMNETSGTAASDMTANTAGIYETHTNEAERGSYTLGEPGFIKGDATAKSVKLLGNGRQLLGYSAGVTVNDPLNLLDPKTELSLEVWLEVADEAGEGYVIFNNADEVNGDFGWGFETGKVFRESVAGKLAFFALNGINSGPRGQPAGEFITTGTPLAKGAHHVVVTFKGLPESKLEEEVGGKKYPIKGECHIYVDGKEVGSAVAEPPIEPEIHYSPGGQLYPQIGGGAGGALGQGWSHGFRGRLGELAVYSKALTAAQVKEHYEQGVGTSIPAATAISDAPRFSVALAERSTPR